MVRSAPSRCRAARLDREFGLAAFHLESLRADDRLGSRRRIVLRRAATEPVELDERDLRMQRSADRAGDWALSTHRHRQSSLLLATACLQRAWRGGCSR